LKQKLRFVEHILQNIRGDDLYRSMRYVSVSGPRIAIGTRNLLNFCSNDYLGLTSKVRISPQIQSSSRLVSGNDALFKKLEKALASHKSQHSALVFPTGYMANLGAISTLVEKNDVILSDELNHASIIEACRLSRAKVIVYKHNDMDDLTRKISSVRKKKTFVITEGVFSMDGDFASLKQITEITEKNNAVLILDDAHGDFTMGTDGRGTASYFGVQKKIDVYVSSLSKGLGAFGGYIASEDPVVDLCINRARPFIYTSALPSFLVEMALHRLMQDRTSRQKKLKENVRRLSTGLSQIGYNITSPTHIIPIIVGSEKTALDFGKYLYTKGIFVQPIRYPTVPKDSARLRVSVTAWLTKKHIESALDVFEKAGRKFGII
jgi:glycine C-acetyltransferase